MKRSLYRYNAAVLLDSRKLCRENFTSKAPRLRECFYKERKKSYHTGGTFVRLKVASVIGRKFIIIISDINEGHNLDSLRHCDFRDRTQVWFHPRGPLVETKVRLIFMTRFPSILYAKCGRR